MHKAEADNQALQKELDQLKVKYTTLEALEVTLKNKVKAQSKASMKKLEDCNNNVVKPLLNELKIS